MGDVVERVVVVFVVLVVRGLGCVVRRLDACPVHSPPGVPGLPAGSARARRHRLLAAAPHGAPATAAAGRRLLRLRSSARRSVCTVEATTRRARRKRWGARFGSCPSWSAESHVTGQAEPRVRRQSRREPWLGARRRSRARGLRSLVQVRARRVLGGGPSPVQPSVFAASVSGGPCACHRLHRRHPRSGAVKPCASRRFASPVGPGLDSPTRGRR